jgi:hypothetical protein
MDLHTYGCCFLDPNRFTIAAPQSHHSRPVHLVIELYECIKGDVH